MDKGSIDLVHGRNKGRRLWAEVPAGAKHKTGERRNSKTSGTELRTIKQRLGTLEFLDFTSVEPEAAHRELGSLVRRQVHSILAGKLDRLTGDQYADWASRTAGAYRVLEEKAASPGISMQVRSAINRYLACLAAWAEGAGLGRFEHPRLSGGAPGLLRPIPTALAWLLQDETVGCQTGLFREQDGSVVLWHTEEDHEEAPGCHFDRLRVISVRVGDCCCTTYAHAFVYPYLLPGPAFAWRSDGYLQAIDSLFVRAARLPRPGILANAATWILLWLGPALSTGEVLQQLGPFADGYAANVAYTHAGKVVAHNYEFAADRILFHPLSDQQGSHLLQVNVGSHGDSYQLRDLECVSPMVRRAYLRRLHRMQRLLPGRGTRGAPSESTLEFVCGALASRVDPEWSYANEDVKAFFAARISPGQLDIRVGPGPASQDEEPAALHVPTGCN